MSLHAGAGIMKTGDRVTYIGIPDSGLVRKFKSALDNETDVCLDGKTGTVVSDGLYSEDEFGRVFIVPDSIIVNFDEVACKTSASYPRSEFELIA